MKEKGGNLFKFRCFLYFWFMGEGVLCMCVRVLLVMGIVCMVDWIRFRKF